MQQEAAHKLQSIEGHGLFLVAVCRITPAKSNLTVFEAQKSTVGDGYAVSVMSQVLNDMPQAQGRRAPGMSRIQRVRSSLRGRRAAWAVEHRLLVNSSLRKPHF